MNKTGSFHIDKRDLQSVKDDPLSKVVFLEGAFEHAIISVLFQIPFEYGMNGPTGLKYEALKDYCRWFDLKPLSKFVPILLRLGSYYASILSAKK